MKVQLTLLLILLTIQALLAQPRTAVTSPPADRITVTVHPGIELLTVVQLLAGKYPIPNKSVYAKEALRELGQEDQHVFEIERHLLQLPPT